MKKLDQNMKNKHLNNKCSVGKSALHSWLLVVCNRYEDIDCGSQSTPAILLKCNRSDNRDFFSLILSELVATQRLHSSNRNYYACSVSSDCIGLVF